VVAAVRYVEGLTMTRVEGALQIPGSILPFAKHSDPVMQASDVMLQLIDRVQSELERLQDRYRTYPTLQPVLEGPIEEAVSELTRLALELDIEYPEDDDLPRRAVV
jgi:hypothetical protein